MRGLQPMEVLDEVVARRSAAGEPALNPYATALVSGVAANATDIDERLSSYAIGWPLERMPAVDRNILRIGAFEVLYSETVPPGAAISEAVGLARDLSTDESPRFVNGLLSRLMALRPAPQEPV